MTLQASNLSVIVDRIPHLADVSFTLQRGRLYTVIGRTLAGKTTLLRAVAGLQELDRGEINLDDIAFSNRPVWLRDVAMVYQQFINYPHLNVLDNIAFPLRRRGMAPAAARGRAAEVLRSVGLTGFEARRPSQLSGGQQQRVALARALARRADILLLDEPLVNLDYKLREQMREEFRGLFATQDGAIVVYTTTEPAEAMMLGNEILVMHEGRLLQVGIPAEVFDRPASTTVAGIINDPPMNIVDGGIEGGRLRFAENLSLPLPEHMQRLPPGDYRFGIRANELTTGPPGSIVGRLTLAEVSGSETFLHVDTQLGPLVLQVEGIHALALATLVPVGIETRRMFAFAAGGQLVAAPGSGEDVHGPH